MNTAINFITQAVRHKTLAVKKSSDPEFDRPAKLVSEMLKSLKAIHAEIKNVQSGSEKFISSLAKMSKVLYEYHIDKDSDIIVTDTKDFRTRQETLDTDCRRRMTSRMSEEVVDILTHKIEMLEKIEHNCETRTKLKMELDHYAGKVDKLRGDPKADPVRIMRNEEKLNEARRQVGIWDEVVKDQVKHFEKVHGDYLKGEVGVIKAIEKEFFEESSKILSDYDSNPEPPELYDPPKHDVVPNVTMGMTGMPGQMGMNGQMGMMGMPGMMGMTGMPGQMGMGQMGMPGQMGMTGMPGMQGMGMGQMGMTGMPGMQGMNQMGMPNQMGMQGMPNQMGMQGMQGQMGMPGMQGMQQQPGMGQMGMGTAPGMPPAMPAAPSAGAQAQALYDFAGGSGEELSFNVGDLVTVTKEDASGWWTGVSNGKTGVFPGNYVQKL